MGYIFALLLDAGDEMQPGILALYLVEVVLVPPVVLDTDQFKSSLDNSSLDLLCLWRRRLLFRGLRTNDNLHEAGQFDGATTWDENGFQDGRWWCASLVCSDLGRGPTEGAVYPAGPTRCRFTGLV